MQTVLPKKVFVKNIVKGRYSQSSKPLSWDDRFGGLDVIEDDTGSEITLESTGNQSSPVKGWQIMLTENGETPGTYRWTLYGIAKV